MSQLTIQISDKADALIAQLQKEIFNRRRKKVTAEGVVETLLESGAKCQSDKRFATSWQNLLADIERAAMVAQAHGSKPSSLSDEEWALVLSHRTRSTTTAEPKRTAKPRATSRATATAAAPARRRAKSVTAKSAASDVLDAGTTTAKPRSRAAAKAKPARSAKATATATSRATASRGAATPRKRASAAVASPKAEKPKAAPKAASRKAASPTTRSSRSSVAKRMAKAASRLVSAPIASIAGSQTPAPIPPVNGGNGVDSGLPTPPVS